LAEREWSEGHAARAEELLDACPAALRGWEWHYLRKLCHAELWTVRGAGNYTIVTLSRDGRRAAWMLSDGHIQGWDTATGQVQVHLTGHPGQAGEANSLTFSPDGCSLVSTTGVHLVPGAVKVWNLATRQEVLNISGRTGRMSGAAFSPDGGRLAVCSGERERPGEVWVWDLPSRAELVRLTDEKARAILGVAWGPDGTTLVTVSGEND